MEVFEIGLHAGNRIRMKRYQTGNKMDTWREGNQPTFKSLE